MKTKECMLAINTRNGHICAQRHFDSIADAVRYAKDSGGFYYRVFVDGKVVRKGFC